MITLTADEAEKFAEWITESRALMAKQAAENTVLREQLEQHELRLDANNCKRAAAASDPANALISAGLMDQSEYSDWVSKVAEDESYVSDYLTGLAQSMCSMPQLGHAALFNEVKEASADRCPFEQIFFPGYSTVRLDL